MALLWPYGLFLPVEYWFSPCPLSGKVALAVKVARMRVTRQKVLRSKAR